MKTISSILTILFGTLIGYFGFKQTKTHEHYVFYDLTSSKAYPLQVSDVLTSTGLKQHPWDGYTIHVIPITDVDFTHEQIIMLDAQDWLLANPKKRQKLCQVFVDSVKTALTMLTKGGIGKSHSSVYIPIARALAKLAKSSATTKALTIAGDVLHNDDFFSSYDSKQINSLRANPKQFMDHFTTLYQLPRLEGITITILHETTSVDNAPYRTMSSFFKALWEAHGATVNIEATLTKPLSP